MLPKIVDSLSKLLVGKQLRMSLAENKTPQLWQSFMPQRKQVANTIGTDLYSLQVYDPELDFKGFNPTVQFDKWALIEVASFNKVPEGMETFTLQGGLYAVFIHQGLPSDFARTFNYIFNEWLPASEYKTLTQTQKKKCGFPLS